MSNSAWSKNLVSGGGRIITQQPAYLEMLREQTDEGQLELHKQDYPKSVVDKNYTENTLINKHLSSSSQEFIHRPKEHSPIKQRIYVESPAFTKEDEETYKFVDPEIGDSDVDELTLLDSLDAADGPTSVKHMPKVPPVKSREKSEVDQKVVDPLANMAAAPLKKSKGEERVWNHLMKDYEYQLQTNSLPKNSTYQQVATGNSQTTTATNTPKPSRLTNAGENLNKTSDNTPSPQPLDYHDHAVRPPSLGPKLVTPIENPLKPLSKEQTDELRQLEEEIKYQEQLKQRINAVEVPRLDLDEVVSDDDDQKQKHSDKHQDSSDSEADDEVDEPVQSQKFQHVQDSLDISRPNAPVVNDERQVQVKSEADELREKYLELQKRVQQLEEEQHAKEQSFRQAMPVPGQSVQPDQGNISSARRMTSVDLKNIQNPAVRSQYQLIPATTPMAETSPVYRGNLPINFATDKADTDDNYFVEQEHEKSSLPFTRHQPEPRATGNVPKVSEIGIYQELPQRQLDNCVPQHAYHSPMPLASAYQANIPQNGYAEYYQAQHYHQNFEDINDPYPDEGNEQDQTFAQHDQEEYIGKDFVKLNKKAIREDVRTPKTYGKLFHVKKEKAQQQPTPVPAPRKKKPAVGSAQSNILSSAHSAASTALPSAAKPSAIDQDDQASNAEKLWARRAQTLMEKQDQKQLSNSAPAGRKKNMRKVQSEGAALDNKSLRSQMRPAAIHRAPAQNNQRPHVHDENFYVSSSPQPPFAAPQRNAPLSPRMVPQHIAYGTNRHNNADLLTSSAPSVAPEQYAQFSRGSGARFYISPDTQPLPGQVGPLQAVQANRQAGRFQNYRQHLPYEQLDQGHSRDSSGPDLYTEFQGENWRAAEGGYVFGAFSDMHEDLSPTPTSSISPYKVIPPISSADRSRYNMEEHVVDAGGSYMQAFEKNKQHKPDYKPYTMNDYKKLRKDIRLGGLGPELENEEIKEKKEKRKRQIEYGRKMSDKNRWTYTQHPPKEKFEQRENSQEDLMDRRKLALEYAKTVPKPKVKPRTASPAVEASPSSGTLQVQARNPHYNFVPGSHTNTMKTTTTLRTFPTTREEVNHNRDMELIDLETLQQRHQQEREKVALIKQNIQA